LWTYYIAAVLFHFLYAIASRFRVEGIENVPMEGGAIVVCNHTKGHDYVPLGISSPRQIFFMAKAEAFEFNWFLRFILLQGGVFPVDRNKGDIHALETAVAIVNSGKLLGMFPEGHRSPDGKLQRGKTGATRIALQAGAPIVPAAVIGAEAAWHNFPRFWRRKYMVVRFGTPFHLEGSANDRAAVAAGTRRIMHEIAALLPEEMRGEWSGNVADAVTPPRRPRLTTDAPSVRDPAHTVAPIS
jgi:1-acyl-sn-glycerol-3-phosphate acyltransferase